MKRPDPALGQPLLFFRRVYGSRRAAERWRMDSTVLVNACLLIFMFYLASSPYVNQPAEQFDIRLPPAGKGKPVPYSAAIITVTGSGLVFLGDQPVEVAKISEHLRDFVEKHPGDTLLIEADERATHSFLMQIVMQARTAGISDIAFATRLPERPIPNEVSR